nr:hypothetical protein [Anoxynatronum buryatiense]
MAKEQHLSKRLEQEILHKGAGTFFRSAGAMLGHTPIPGYLKSKSNQNNYAFSGESKRIIIDRLKRNVNISIVGYKGDFSVERNLVEKYQPILNIKHNPRPVDALIEARKRNRLIAQG